ncbi:hypothetical protein [uncultured Muribaculum sp.]|uniref:hypothetical protein n=1 Tax=uncultured Muribaculum sp. TaxID=1918613 RepID=UPI0025B79840|nr:hypothetical protein [uncultured Muribaculum sp.]
MRKIVSIIGACAILALAGCSNTNNEKQSQPIEVETLSFLDRFVDSLFTEFPNALNNDVTRTQLADTIKARLSKYQGGKLPFLSECPVTFYHSEFFPHRVFDTVESNLDKNADRVLVQFVYKPDPTIDRNIAFSIMTAIDKEDAAALIDGEEYIVDGTFKFFPGNTHENVFYLPNHKLAQNITTVSTESGIPLIMLGNFIMDDVSFKRVEQ